MFLNVDDMIECPYNSTHRMLRKRLQSHLLKCRVHYPDVELRKCPFNITHLIPDPEFAHHATNCPDRKLITQYKYDAPEQKEEEIPKHAPVECDENWDDTDVKDYNPRLHLEKAKVLLKPRGTSRSERKLFIKKERKRLGDDEDSSDDGSKYEASSSRSKRQKYDYYRDEDRSESGATYSQEARSRYRSISPTSSSSLSGQGYRFKSGIDSSRNHSRSPTGLRRSREYSPPRHSSSYTRKLALPSHSYLDTPLDHYYRNGRTPNNDQYNSGRDEYYSYYGYPEYYARHPEAIYSMPQAPPPPVISYPASRCYSYPYHPYPPFSKR